MSEPTVFTASGPTGLLRWKNGSLQQQWKLTVYTDGIRTGHSFEWRNVPEWVPGDK